MCVIICPVQRGVPILTHAVAQDCASAAWQQQEMSESNGSRFLNRDKSPSCMLRLTNPHSPGLLAQKQHTAFAQVAAVRRTMEEGSKNFMLFVGDLNITMNEVSIAAARQVRRNTHCARMEGS